MIDDVEPFEQPIQLPSVDPHPFAYLRPFEAPGGDSVLQQPEPVFVLIVDFDRRLAPRAENEDRVDYLGGGEIEGDELLDLVYPHLHARRP